MIKELSIRDIILPSPKRLKEKTKDYLVEHILRYGQPKPIKVEPSKEGKYKLLDGYHTLWALRELGYDAVVAQIVENKNANLGNPTTAGNQR